jgi:hypothetical protein
VSTPSTSSRRWPLVAASALAVIVAAGLAVDNIRLRTNLKAEQGRAALVPAAAAPVVAPPVAEAPKEVRTPRARTADDAAAAARIAELEKLLKDREASLADMRANSANRQADTAPTERPGRGNFNPQGWMEDLKTRDPQRYEEMQARFKEMGQKTSSYLGKQDEFLKSLKTENMTPEQQDNHAKLQEALAKAKEISEQLNADPEGPKAGELRGQLFQAMRDSRELLEGERQIALQDMAGQLGYTKEQTPQFVEYVNSIYEMTNPGTIFRSVMGGGEGGRGGFPGGGRGGNRDGGTGGGGR